MTVPECPREPDVIAAVVAGRWPEQCDDALHAHVVQCELCTELVGVASLMRLDRDGLNEEMTVPGAGQVWWRAAIRARLEASQQAARPVSWVMGVAVACIVGLAVGVAELLWSPVQSVLRSTMTGWTMSPGLGEITRWLPSFPSLTDLTPLMTTGAFVLLGAAACLVLAPLALYFALSDE